MLYRFISHDIIYLYYFVLHSPSSKDMPRCVGCIVSALCALRQAKERFFVIIGQARVVTAAVFQNGFSFETNFGLSYFVSVFVFIHVSFWCFPCLPWYFQIFPYSFRDAARKLFLEAGPVKLSFLQLRIQSDEPLQSFQSWTLEPAWWTMMDCSCVTGTRVTGFAHWRPLSR